MPINSCLAATRLLLAMTISGLVCPAQGAGTKMLPGHVPEVVRHMASLGALAATNDLDLAIGLPLRDPAGLTRFLADVYDPASPAFHQFLTPEELALRFGPTDSDYWAVKMFALTNGLKIIGTHGNRLLLDVSGHPADVEQAFHFHLHRFKHPMEAREFFAPDAEPSVDATLPLVDIQGLSDYSRPHPNFRRRASEEVASHVGTSPDGQGLFFGDDFRNAYVPGTTLTGAGQMVGLVEFDGYYSNDIAFYAAYAGGGRTNIPIQTILINGFSGTPTTGMNSGNGEVALDIEMAMAMAPGLSKIIVFEASPHGIQNDVLNTMLASNTVKNLSCSWGWGGGANATTDAIFQMMAAAGQSFFDATGDSDAFVPGSNNDVDSASQQRAPAGSPYITQVGGVILATNGFSGGYTSESAWNDRTNNPSGGYWGTSGGITTNYAIPSWQTNISMSANGGSTTKRNLPDVALTAANIYSTSDNGSDGDAEGTSCAAPLWAGFMALVNQRAAITGNPPAGFVNPAIYAIGKGANPNFAYTNCFHDTASGDNFWPGSPAKYASVPGFDLCTGWGTPNGTNLLNALAISVGGLEVQPAGGLAFAGSFGGPYNPSSGSFVLTNTSVTSLNWSLVVTSIWLTASITNGSLATHTGTNLGVSLAPGASSLAVGNHVSTLLFSNKTSHLVQNIPISLQILQPLSLAPPKGFTAVGPVGGPFRTNSLTLTLTNLSSNPLNWSLIRTSAWLNVSSSNGLLAVGRQTNVTVSLSTTASTLPAAIYDTSLVFSNFTGPAATVGFRLAVGQPVMQNGGFETGGFDYWILSGNTPDISVTSGSASYVHGGTYGAVLGPSGSPGYLSQKLFTIPGQTYLLSLWIRNSSGQTPNSFQVQWNGSTIYSEVDMTATAWTNLQFLVTATGSPMTLQFVCQDDPGYISLDDITITPAANPAFTSFVKNGNSFVLTFGATLGLTYQMQYKTNLTQAAWVNLGNAITATTNKLSVTDTNVLSTWQRFYHLQVTQ